MIHLRRSWTLFSLALLTAAPLASQLIPLGPEFRINETDLHTLEAPALALDGSGRLIATWATQAQDDILVRFFSRDGEPAGPAIPLAAAGQSVNGPNVAVLSSGGFALLWDNSQGVLPLPPTGQAGDAGTLSLRLLDVNGIPVSQERSVSSSFGGASHGRLAARPAGGFAVSWDTWSAIYSQVFTEDATPAGDPLYLFSLLPIDPQPDFLANEALVSLEDGGFVTVTANRTVYTEGLRARVGTRFDAAWKHTGWVFDSANGSVAVGRKGEAAIASSGVFPLSNDMDVRLIAPQQPNPVTIIENGDQFVEAVAMDAAGRVLVVWSNERPHGTPGYDAFVDGDLTARLFDAKGNPLGPAFPVAANTEGDQTGVRVIEKDGEWIISWVNELALTGGGNMFARRFATCATDGTALCLADRFRVEVAFQTGPGGKGTGQAVPLTGDTGAFWFFSPENIELVVKAIDGSALNGHFWVFYGALSNVAYDVTVTDTVTGEKKVYHNPAGTMASRADTGAFPSFDTPFLCTEALLPAAESTAAEPFGCAPMPGFPCLHGGRFSADVTWRIPGTGQTGSGRVIGLTNDSVYVWFFDSNNVELLIKILDGRAVNGKYWVFYGALSDVEYTITVTDHLTGKVKTYHNPAGTMASRADTSAF